MISKELEFAYKEIIDENDNCEFVRRLFQGLSACFSARLIASLINLLSRLSIEKNSPRDRLNALVRDITVD